MSINKHRSIMETCHIMYGSICKHGERMSVHMHACMCMSVHVTVKTCPMLHVKISCSTKAMILMLYHHFIVKK